MSLAERNGLIVGVLLGLWGAWSNWHGDTLRAVSSIVGATAICWLVGRYIGKRSK